jgi:hypothetical protein
MEEIGWFEQRAVQIRGCIDMARVFEDGSQDRTHAQQDAAFLHDAGGSLEQRSPRGHKARSVSAWDLACRNWEMADALGARARKIIERHGE